MSIVAQHNSTTAVSLGENTDQFSQLRTFYDSKYKAGWFLMHGSPRPCFTPQLLSDITTYFYQVRQEMIETAGEKYDFLVLGSDVDATFNLGGDLELFATLIADHNREGLLSYAAHCVDVLYDNMAHLGTELTTIAVVKGDALGSGFESALSSNVLIAERGTKLGLPEVLFNLFPSMGAYPLLSYKVGTTRAEKMIMSGALHTAEELYAMGVVDILAEAGEGELEAYRFMHNANKMPNSHKAMRKVKDITNPFSYEELIEVIKVWADAALKLTPRDMKMMGRLIQRQPAKAVL